MSIKQLLLQQKMQEILELCNDDLRDVREYLISEFNLPKGYSLTREMKLFEELLKLQTNDIAKNDRMAEFLEKLKGNGYDDKILD